MNVSLPVTHEHRPRVLAAVVLGAVVVAAIAAVVGGAVVAGRGGGGGGGGAGGESRAEQACPRPYGEDSPWNTPIGDEPAVAMEEFRLQHDPDASLSSDPTQYTYPVYRIGERTPRRTVEVRGLFSHVRGDRTLHIQDGGTIRLPLPRAVEAAEGSDAQFVLVDWHTGAEYGVWKAERDGDGRWTIENGYRYDVDWDGVPPATRDGRPFGSRGAGVPYLTGLVRPCEIERGRIDHALAFGYDWPSDEHVYPATKSDGIGDGPDALPEGTRLQLDPSLTRGDLRAMGCAGPCLTIARALQRYGMYVIDNAGRPKIMLEYEGTADWGDTVDDKTVDPLPLSAFRVLEPQEPPARDGG